LKDCWGPHKRCSGRARLPGQWLRRFDGRRTQRLRLVRGFGNTANVLIVCNFQIVCCPDTSKGLRAWAFVSVFCFLICLACFLPGGAKFCVSVNVIPGNNPLCDCHEKRSTPNNVCPSRASHPNLFCKRVQLSLQCVSGISHLCVCGPCGGKFDYCVNQPNFQNQLLCAGTVRARRHVQKLRQDLRCFLL